METKIQKSKKGIECTQKPIRIIQTASPLRSIGPIKRKSNQL